MREVIHITPTVDYLLERDVFHFHQEGPLTRPISVCVHVNHWCNLECSYCLSNSGPREERAQTSLEHIVETLARTGPLRVVWSGGEPTLFNSIAASLMAARRASLINIVTSNGTVFPSPDVLENAHWIDISIHGVNRESYFQTTHRDLFEKVLFNIELLVRSGARVSASAVLHRRLAPGLFDLIGILREIGIRKFRLSRLLPLGRGESDMEYDLTDQDVEKLGVALRERAGDMEVVLPAIRKRRLLLDGYFVLENDARLSSPPAVAGKTLPEASMTESWVFALQAHQLLFNGISD